MKKIHSLFLLFLLFRYSCKKSKDVSDADKHYKIAENFYDKGKYDEAFTHFYPAYQGYASEKRAVDAAYALIFLGIIQTEKGDFLGSNENLSKAAKLAGSDAILLTSIYNQFAINHNFLRNDGAAVYWYKKALLLTGDPYSQLSIKNNMGVSYIKMGKYAEAKKTFKNIASNPTIQDSIDFKNRVFDNFAYSKFLSGDTNRSGDEMLTVLSSRQERDDRFGITASLSHLADFYRNTDHKRSLEFASAMYENARKTGNADDQLEALKKMIYTEEAGNIKPLFEKYRTLNDRIEKSQNNSKNQFASVIHELEKNKADLLDSRNQILKHRLSILTLTAFLIVAILWFAKWRKQQAFQKELAVKDTQIKYARKVHDVVANGLYHKMVEIENRPELDRQAVLNSIEKLYEESRDIARDDLDTLPLKDFSLRLFEMIDSYSSANQRVLIIGNTPEIWATVPAEVQTEIFYVLRELIINMKKHSRAKFASLKILSLEKNLQIKYTDNGIGMDVLGSNKKSGVQNMENRIEKLGGKFNFEPNPKGGLITEILIPNH